MEPYPDRNRDGLARGIVLYRLQPSNIDTLVDANLSEHIGNEASWVLDELVFG